jgi:hypothetical protein
LTLPASGAGYTDAQILFYSVEQHPVFGPLFRPLWQAVQTGQLEVFTSELSLLETLVAPYETGDAARAATYEAFFVQQGNTPPRDHPVNLARSCPAAGQDEVADA